MSFIPLNTHTHKNTITCVGCPWSDDDCGQVVQVRTSAAAVFYDRVPDKRCRVRKEKKHKERNGGSSLGT